MSLFTDDASREGNTVALTDRSSRASDLGRISKIKDIYFIHYNRMFLCTLRKCKVLTENIRALIWIKLFFLTVSDLGQLGVKKNTFLLTFSFSPFLWHDNKNYKLQTLCYWKSKCLRRAIQENLIFTLGMLKIKQLV